MGMQNYVCSTSIMEGKTIQVWQSIGNLGDIRYSTSRTLKGKMNILRFDVGVRHNLMIIQRINRRTQRATPHANDAVGRFGTGEGSQRNCHSLAIPILSTT